MCSAISLTYSIKWIQSPQKWHIFLIICISTYDADISYKRGNQFPKKGESCYIKSYEQFYGWFDLSWSFPSYLNHPWIDVKIRNVFSILLSIHFMLNMILFCWPGSFCQYKRPLVATYFQARTEWLKEITFLHVKCLIIIKCPCACLFWFLFWSTAAPLL